MLNKRSLSAIADQRGAAAVEFALIVPIMMMFFFGLTVFSVVLSTYGALQQMAAEAARASLAGLSTTQQSQYASQYISAALGNYTFLDPTQVTVTTNATPSAFQVTISYNAGHSFLNNFASSVISSPIIITRSATIQLSGFGI